MTKNTRKLMLDTLAEMIDDNKAGHCIESRLAMIRVFIVSEKPQGMTPAQFKQHLQASAEAE